MNEEGTIPIAINLNTKLKNFDYEKTIQFK